ncbi:PEPxxWA-CTERM sorting domain-containing protein [Phenylobacterium sp.]|jgi:hypothetical protein|uniref:PEPxxWA-CTERM sorting domain-containing protein n=1 Tax=Phenylobacterium sp. TaxID=1871053 RepID=UPI002F3FF0D6
MFKRVLGAAALAAAAGLVAASSAQASSVTVLDTQLAAPGVYRGIGNFNTGYAVTTDSLGVEIGLKSKINRDPNDTVQPVGDVYSFDLGEKVNIDYSVNPDFTGTEVDISQAIASITILNLRTGTSATFNPETFGGDASFGSTVIPGHDADGGYQNSEQLGFFPAAAFSLTTNDTYDVTLSLSGLPNGDTISVENVVKYGTGAIPEPASWALMLLGFGSAGALLRRRRQAVAA